MIAPLYYNIKNITISSKTNIDIKNYIFTLYINDSPVPVSISYKGRDSTKGEWNGVFPVNKNDELKIGFLATGKTKDIIILDTVYFSIVCCT